MEKVIVGLLTVFMILAIGIGGCSFFGKKKEIKPFTSEVVHPDWSKDIVMYEVNVRQYTDEGTFAAFAEHLPRLKSLGIDVLWFMPTFPIGKVSLAAIIQ
jgi:cyclomaltodextrinase